jgi:hypothetical protein
VGAPIGNQNARKERRLWGDTINRVLAQNDSEKLRKAAETLVDLAMAGDVSALRELGDRVDGKPKQEVEHSGDLIVNIAQPDANA